MKEQEKIEHAIAILSNQRDIIGHDVVDTTLLTLQERLALLQERTDIDSPPSKAQRKQVTTLFATITGLHEIVDTKHDTNFLDIMKLLWKRLDQAIIDQGGVIDKHINDGVMALFGAPIASEDAPERAVRAALTMRAVLSDFVSEMETHEGASLISWRKQTEGNNTNQFKNLQLRVGINTGPVLLGKVGTSDEHTAIGAAVNVASRLEQAAPSGGILISHQTFLLVKGIFTVEPIGPVIIKGKNEPVQAHLILGVNPRAFYPSDRGVAGIQTQMVGRSHEMGILQKTLFTSIQTGLGQLVKVYGDAGVGKSRLLYEYIKWVESLPDEIMIIKGRTDHRMSQIPYSLFRDLLATHFGIQDNDKTVVVEDKLARGIFEYAGENHFEAQIRGKAIGQLVGLSVAGGSQFLVAQEENPQIRDRVFNYIASFFEAIALEHSALLIILEDIHWADEKSLELIDYLSFVCNRAPLLLIGLTRPRLSDYPASDTTKTKEEVYGLSSPEPLIIKLKTLSNDESHLLVEDILRKVPDIPDDLGNLIVSKAEGNPFYVEELIKVLIEDGVIVTGEKQWHIQKSRYQNIRVSPSLTGVLQARLDRLSSLELMTLQRAAVVGRTFWDSAVIRMGEMADKPMSDTDTKVALNALEKRELIFKQKKSSFAGIEAFMFKHAVLRDITYESVLLRNRPIYHKLVADWLAEQSGNRVSEFSGIIAEHYEHAGETFSAAELYEMAATRAKEMYNPDVAIDYYLKALSLISKDTYHIAWQVSLQQQLGNLLQLQARLVEAAQTYMTMQYLAELDGDLVAQAYAWNGLASIYREQADYKKMLKSAQKAEEVAWLVGADEELLNALHHKSDAFLRLAEFESAVSASNQALGRILGMDAPKELSMTLGLLCSIYIEAGNFSEVNKYLKMLEEQDRDTGSKEIIESSRIYIKYSLGKVHQRLGNFDTATSYLSEALDLYRGIDYQEGIAHTLNLLGETARLRGDPEPAIPFFSEAISIARSVGDKYGQFLYRMNLGGALAALGDCNTAVIELSQVINHAKDVGHIVNWVGLPKACVFLAEAYLGQEEIAEALTMALQAHSLAIDSGDTLLMGVIWRLLGKVSARLPPQELPIILDTTPNNPPGCFKISLELLRTMNQDDKIARREQFRTLIAWSIFEQSRGNSYPSDKLKQEAQLLNIAGLKQ